MEVADLPYRIVTFGQCLQALAVTRIPYSTACANKTQSWLELMPPQSRKEREKTRLCVHQTVQSAGDDQRGVSVKMHGRDVVEMCMQGLHALSCVQEKKGFARASKGGE